MCTLGLCSILKENMEEKKKGGKACKAISDVISEEKVVGGAHCRVVGRDSQRKPLWRELMRVGREESCLVTFHSIA